MSVTIAMALVAQALATSTPQAPPTHPTDIGRVEREAWVMGTRARIVVEESSVHRASARSEAILREVERVDALLSTWDPNSPLSRLNRAAPGTPLPLDGELGALLAEAVAWSVRTGGTFEPVIGALVDAWALRGAGRTPSASEIADALAATGPRGASVQDEQLIRSHHAAWIDSGAFGKGAALRSVERTLLGTRAAPTSRVLVDLGGQVLAFAPSDAPWHVRVAHPADRQRVVRTLAVSRGSVATSGSSERGPHVIDPRSGRPVEPWGSVTVVHPDPFAADVLSTALYVMGPEAGLDFAERNGVAALLLTDDPVRSETAGTSHMTPYLVEVGTSGPSPSLAPIPQERQHHEP